MAAHTLELVKGEVGSARHKGKDIPLPSYDVLLDGEKIGRVYRAMVTRERRTPGRRYVDARWTSPGWSYQRADVRFRGNEVASRRDGIERLVRDADSTLTWTEAEDLADTVRKVR